MPTSDTGGGAESNVKPTLLLQDRADLDDYQNFLEAARASIELLAARLGEGGNSSDQDYSVKLHTSHMIFGRLGPVSGFKVEFLVR